MSAASGIRFEPDPRVSTAKPAEIAEECRALHRQLGRLIVGRWTYRPLRVITRLLLPPFDRTGVRVRDEPGLGRRAISVWPDEVRGEGAVLLIHGGGYVIGSPGDTRGKAALLARECGVPVFCPSYRLAPQNPFPAGLDDCHAAWKWLLAQSEKHDLDPSKLVIGGISAGGGHAAALAQRLHDEGDTQPAGQLLIYPMVDDRTAARRELDALRHSVWSNRNNLFGWTSYLGHAPGEPSPPYAVPARREDLSGLPSTWLGVGTCDVFLDEDREYARRLREAGVDVTFVEVDGAIHAFDAMGEGPLTRGFDDSMAEFVRQRTT